MLLVMVKFLFVPQADTISLFQLLVPERPLAKWNTASAPEPAAIFVLQNDVVWLRVVAEIRCLGPQTLCCNVIH